MRRVVYKEASIPDDVLQNISYEKSGQRYYAPIYRAVSCTQDGLFLFAALVSEQLDSGRIDRLYYVVVNANATEWRSGSVSLSQFRPTGAASYSMHLPYAGRWTWDGRTFTCLLRVLGVTDIITQEDVAFCDVPSLKHSHTIDRSYDHFIVQIDTSSESIVASSSSIRGSRHDELITIKWGPILLYYSRTIEDDWPISLHFVGKTDVVYIRHTVTHYNVQDNCTGFSSFSRSERWALVYAGTEVLSSEEPGFLSGFAIQDTVVEHAARSGAYILSDVLSHSNRIIGCGTRIIADIPTEPLTVGERTVYMLLLTTIGASDDARLRERDVNIVGATDDTISVFIDSPSKRMVTEGKDIEDFTTWWLLTISLSTGRVIQEVKLEPVYMNAPPWDAEAEGVTRAEPMVSLLDGSQFRILKR
jgi:hypothetical protein